MNDRGRNSRNRTSCHFSQRSMAGLGLVLVLCLAARADTANRPAPPSNPVPRAILDRSLVSEWRFRDGLAGWRIERDANWKPAESSVHLTVTGIDPILISPPIRVAGTAHVRVRLRTTAPGPLQFFWGTDDQPNFTEAASHRLGAKADGEWREYEFTATSKSPWKRLRFDPAGGPGSVELDWLRVEQHTLHPLEVERVNVDDENVVAVIRNHGTEAYDVRLGNQQQSVAAGQTWRATWRRPELPRPVDVLSIVAESPGLPPVSRPVVVVNPKANSEWLTLSHGELTANVASNGSGAQLKRAGQTVAWLAPLVWRDGVIPNLSMTRQETRLVGSGGAVRRLELALDEAGLHFSLDADEACEGPVLRAAGQLEQGLLAGVEHLGRGEASSSSLDIHGPERIRDRPDPMLVTMPLMAFVTDRASAALTWDDMSLQPTFATPNFYDGTPDHRCSLSGPSVRAVVRIGNSYEDGERLEDAILWSVRRRGLPALPAAPRTDEDQTNLILTSFEQSVVKGRPEGWYHAAIPGGKTLPDKPMPFGDVHSVIFRLSGKLPDGALVAGGSHIDNDAVFFLTGRAAEWLERVRSRARQAARGQAPDGSYRYAGPYQEGHFEDTASGYCAQFAVSLLQYAQWTGDSESLAAGLKTLEYMKRFRTPRGASVWECPLHAPDLLASAHLVRAYLLGFELTGRDEYRELAVRWAISGVPYVYQWSNRPVMLYATTGTLCATHYVAPVWIGRPVQWMGVVYADSLLDLADHDQTLDWRKLAKGILISAEQQQYPDGPSIGCLADSLLLSEQQLLPFDINPAAVATLRLRVKGEVAGLTLATDGTHRLVAPFPVNISGETATIRARAGLKYQVVLDGKRVISITSQGNDTISLQAAGE